MLLNLSNHPSHNWDKKQTEAAKLAFGEIVDIEFPQIDPEWDQHQIWQIAQEFCNNILLAIVDKAHNKNAVHLMGETVFCFCLANMLKDAGVQCVASTTRRNAVEKNGVKTSVFEFVQFRNYYDL
ncbi:MAG: hypothetical protein PHW92_09660 [Lutibacter sp.]|nr:hypothetical protein [Lutibacter sp.]